MNANWPCFDVVTSPSVAGSLFLNVDNIQKRQHKHTSYEGAWVRNMACKKAGFGLCSFIFSGRTILPDKDALYNFHEFLYGFSTWETGRERSPGYNLIGRPNGMDMDGLVDL